jgi:ABC-type antimicrobial peptide transport system permease subunit
MPARSRTRLTVVGVAVGVALAGVTLAIGLGSRVGLVCPHISRSTAINSVIGKATGYSARARLTTFGEFEAADPSMGHGSSQELGTLVWVVAVSGKMPNFAVGPAPGRPEPPLHWMVVASNASTGDMMLREGGFIGSWPPYFSRLPDRAWFCPG